jgi:hypothetical protein
MDSGLATASAIVGARSLPHDRQEVAISQHSPAYLLWLFHSQFYFSWCGQKLPQAMIFTTRMATIVNE